MPDLKDWSQTRLTERHAELKITIRALLDESRAITGTLKAPKSYSDAEHERVRGLLIRGEEFNDERKSIEAEKDRRKNAVHVNPYAEKDRKAMEALKKEWPDGIPGLRPSNGVTAVGGKARDSRWSNMALSQMQKSDPYGRLGKSLASAGSVLVPTAYEPGVYREGERATLTRQLIPSQELRGTDRFSFMRQTVRQNNAAAVAKGALKPTSSYKVERLEDRVRVIAHLSEPIARQDLEDSADLAAFLDAEMRFGVLAAGEQQILTGDGTGEDLIGIINTPGILAQPFSGDILTTLRRALTSQQVLSNNPTAWVLSPEDWSELELMREDGTTGAYMLSSGPVDRAAQRLWGLPVVVSSAMTTGQALLGDFAGSAKVFQREDPVVSWSEAMYRPDGAGGGSTDFARNQMVWRVEERVGLAVLRPSAFTDVDLTA